MIAPPSSPWMPPAVIGLAVITALCGIVRIVVEYRGRWLRSQAKAQHWFDRSRELEAEVAEHKADANYWVDAAIEAYKQLGSPLPEDRKAAQQAAIYELIRSTGAKP